MNKLSDGKKRLQTITILKPHVILITAATGYDRNLFLISSFSLKSYNSVHQSKQGIISAASYIHTRMDLGSALSVKNVSGLYKLSVRSLGSKSLGLGISAVLCRTYTLFMSEKLKVQSVIMVITPP